MISELIKSFTGHLVENGKGFVQDVLYDEAIGDGFFVQSARRIIEGKAVAGTANANKNVGKWIRNSEEETAELRRGRDTGSGSGMQGSGTDGSDALGRELRISKKLMDMYVDVENMDDYPEASAAFDLYAEDSTIPDSASGKSIWVDSEDATIKGILEDLFHRRLVIEDDIFGISRTLSKYGNVFAELLIKDGLGVVGLNFLDPPTMRRIESDNGVLLGFVQDPSCAFVLDHEVVTKAFAGKGNLTEFDDQLNGCVLFYPWQVAHWRLRGKQMRSAYGSSVLDSSRWIWKRLVRIEDTALLCKLMRSPGRYVFYVDVGDLPDKQAKAHVNSVKREYQKVKLINPATGQLDFRTNPLSPHEDFFIATRGGQDTTRIDVLSGPDNQMMDDVDYFRSKFIASTKVPKRYFGLEEGDTLGRAASQDDVRFGRSAMRVQREIRNGFRHIQRVHLAALNIDPDRVRWENVMTVPSYVYELELIALRNAEAELAANLEPFMTKAWIMKNVFKMSSAEASGIVRQKKAQDDLAAQAEDDLAAGDEEDVAEGRVDRDMRLIRDVSTRLRRLEEMVRKNQAVSNGSVRSLNEISGSLKRIQGTMPIKSGATTISNANAKMRMNGRRS